MLYRAKGSAQGLIQHLNEQQSFRVLLKTPNTIYADGAFYRLSLPVGKEFNADRYHVGCVLRPVSRLSRIGWEKGEACLEDRSDWSANSLFGMISHLGKRYGDELGSEFGAPGILVCDDLETEMADFILADRRLRRVVLITQRFGQQKSRDTACSRRATWPMCSQAIKNIHYLSMFNETPPKAREVVTEVEG